jgi:chaperonin GroES
MEKLTPLGNNVIVKPIAEEQVSKGGIIIPDTAKEKPHEGEIIAAGPGKVNKAGNLKPMDVKVGDRVIYAKYTGSEIKVEGEKYLIMPESDILAIKVTGEAAKTSAAPARSKAKGKKNG